MTATETRQGIGVSPGSAYGPVVQVAPPVRPPVDEPAVDDREAALADVKAAFESVAQALEGKARHADDTAQQILKATALIARDKGLVKAADKQLAAGRGRATAIANAVEEYCVEFEALGGYFAERVTDLRDVGSRAVAAVLGVAAPGVPDFSEPSVVVAEDLAPAETATLDRSLVVGIVTQAGGAPATPPSSPPRWASRRWSSSPAPPASRRAPRWRSTATPARSPSPPTSRWSRRRGCGARSGPRRSPPAAARASPATAPTWRCSRTSAGSRTPRPPAPSTSRGSGCSAPSSSSSRPTRRRRSTSRPRSTGRCSRPSAAGVWSSARWTPGPTSRWPSPTSARRTTPPSAAAGCGCRPSAPSCSTPSSRRSPWPPRTPGPTCGSWRRWWPRPRRPPGSPAGCARTACPRPG